MSAKRLLSHVPEGLEHPSLLSSSEKTHTFLLVLFESSFVSLQNKTICTSLVQNILRGEGFVPTCLTHVFIRILYVKGNVGKLFSLVNVSL